MRGLGILVACGALAACTQAEVQSDLATPGGQLFCAVETVDGPRVIALTSALGAGAVMATGVAQAVVDADCAAATAAVANATGPATPISPPVAATAVQTVPIVPAAATPKPAA